MSKMSAKEKRIMILAYFHRYGWIVTMMVCSVIWLDHMIGIFSAGCLVFSLWSFVGYKNRWKHIYCSFQDAYHQKMTPGNIRWNQVKKQDAYGAALLFFVLGLVLLFYWILG